MSLCPCGSELDRNACCGPILAGGPAPTAEALMRSRYSAYVEGNIDHVERSSTGEAKTEFDRKDAENFSKNTKWKGIKVLRTEKGGAKDDTGIVEFVFFAEQSGQTYQQHEVAEFVRENGRWMFKNSEVNPARGEPVRVEQIGRNDPCPCGSKKKYKKCCGG